VRRWKEFYMSEVADLRRVLAERVRRRQFTLAPGVYDLISARLADGLGFDALYMTGYGVAASHLGLPDAGLATYTDMVGRARLIAEATSTALIADADTGYGGLLNVHHTVRGYEAAGVAAVQIEDQVFPKKCGHTPDRRVIPCEEMVRKGQVAAEARRSPDTLIVARTDARTGHGLDEAIDRGRAYAEAGADVIFIESPESEAEFERIGREVDAALLANMVENGRSPVLPAKTLEAMGFAIAIYPGTGFSAAAAALDTVYRQLREQGSTLAMEQPLYDAGAMHALMGFEEVWEFERRWKP
jgi:2,3-dimethylmalate lyase